MDVRETYLATASAFAALVDGIAQDQWNLPGLGVWDVRSLTGHASRALITVITYLDRPASTEAVTSAVDYYVAAKAIADADSQAVTQRGIDAGIALGDDPAVTVRQLVNDVDHKLQSVDGDPLIETIAGGMRVSNYLPTRLFELIVHGMDLARATGHQYSPPVDAISEMTLLAARIGSALGLSPEILMALTGRNSLPKDFSVV